MDNTTLQIANIKHALDDLKLGLSVAISGRTYCLEELQNKNTLCEDEYLLVTQNKAKTLGIGDDATRLQNIPPLNDPACKGGVCEGEADTAPADDIDKKLLELAKMTGFLPSLIVKKSTDALTEIKNIEHIDTYIKYTQTGFQKIAETQISLKRLENAKIILFRSPSGSKHFAIQSGELSDTPIVRVHSACITGDLFESLKCDCGQQLHRSFEIINKEGGLVLYLNQEGRSIGILNKLRAYNLQREGFDTVEANEMLGFSPDERSFSVASDILKAMGITRVRLLTNNPKKQDELESEGIKVIERIPISITPQENNESYLKTKKNKLGHWM